MNRDEFKSLLNDVAAGSLSVDEAMLQFKLEPFKEIEGVASVDLHRGIRRGASEVIYGRGKTKEQIDVIAHALWESGQNPVIITGMSSEAAEFFNRDIPFTYFEEGKIGMVGEKMPCKNKGKIVVATAGTSDIPVAEEAALTAEILGNDVTRIYDVGVAGIHRLFAHAEEIMTANVIIAIAGMEGALASVIGGIAECPVIAVPTSVGYGTSFGGITALLSMLNSCSSGVSVVNIDNGFGAAYMANMINKMVVSE